MKPFLDETEALFKQLEQLGNLTREDFLEVQKYLKAESYQPGAFIWRESESYLRVGFIFRGLVKKYYLTHEGKEFIKEFSAENEIIAPHSSLIQGNPALFSAQTLEPTDILSLEWKVIENLYQKNMRWMNLGKRFAEIQFIRREQRELEFLKYSAKERLIAFKKQFSHLQSRLKKQDIASYLGVTPVSLSRILNDI